MKHPFTEIIFAILRKRFRGAAEDIFEKSFLIQYLNLKTRSADSGSKSRGAFANHYALYVLVEDYITKGFLSRKRGQYKKYAGARFTDLIQRQRKLPFGSKLQNHALNSRLNDEFAKYFPTNELRPILRDQAAQRYWINERLLLVRVGTGQNVRQVNIAKEIIEIINKYVETKRAAFDGFIKTCREISILPSEKSQEVIDFITSQLQPNVDARIFEIVSFSILKAHYEKQAVFWGWSAKKIKKEFLMLYKTGRTNANDGGIDFVMKPLGRFFQVTEIVDANKYFLDIDKVHRFPLTFVVKSVDPEAEIRKQLRQEAQHTYGVNAVVEKYMSAVEELINIPRLFDLLARLVKDNKVKQIMNEIVLQSRVEFNVAEDEEDELAADE